MTNLIDTIMSQYEKFKEEENFRAARRNQLEELMREKLAGPQITADQIPVNDSKQEEALARRRKIFEDQLTRASMSPAQIRDEYIRGVITQGGGVKNKIKRFFDSVSYGAQGGEAATQKYVESVYDKNRKFINTELKEEDRIIRDMEAEIGKNRRANQGANLKATQLQGQKESAIINSLLKSAAMGDKSAIDSLKLYVTSLKTGPEIDKLKAQIKQIEGSESYNLGIAAEGKDISNWQSASGRVYGMKKAIDAMLRPKTEQRKMETGGIENLGTAPNGQQLMAPKIGLRSVSVPPAQADIQRFLPPNLQNIAGNNFSWVGQQGSQPQQMQSPQPMGRSMGITQPPITDRKIKNDGPVAMPGDKYEIPKRTFYHPFTGAPLAEGPIKNQQQRDEQKRAQANTENLAQTVTNFAKGFKQRSSIDPTKSVVDVVFGSFINSPNVVGGPNRVGTLAGLSHLIQNIWKRNDNDSTMSDAELHSEFDKLTGRFPKGTPEREFAAEVIPALTRSIMGYVVDQSGKQINKQELQLYRSIFPNLLEEGQVGFHKLLDNYLKAVTVSQLRAAGYELSEISSITSNPYFQAERSNYLKDVAARAAGSLGGSSKFDLSELTPTNILGNIMEKSGVSLPGGTKVKRRGDTKKSPVDLPKLYKKFGGSRR